MATARRLGLLRAWHGGHLPACGARRVHPSRAVADVAPLPHQERQRGYHFGELLATCFRLWRRRRDFVRGREVDRTFACQFFWRTIRHQLSLTALEDTRRKLLSDAAFNLVTLVGIRLAFRSSCPVSAFHVSYGDTPCGSPGPHVAREA